MSKYSDDFRIEIKKGFLEAVGSMADYRIRINAGGWVDKDVLTEDDFLEICDAINSQYIVPEPPVEEPIEDGTTEIEDETILDDEEGTETEITTDETVENTYLDENIF